MKSQTIKILEALKDHPEGLHPTYFIVDLHIYQYNARIHELREMFGCNCKNSNYCSAKEHIKNKDLNNGTTLFIYKKDPEIDWETKRQSLIKKAVHSANSNPMPLFRGMGQAAA
jgi:hypothetical protein